MPKNEPIKTNAVCSTGVAELMAAVAAVGLWPHGSWLFSVSNTGRFLEMTGIEMWVGMTVLTLSMLGGFVVVSRIRSTKQMLSAAKVYADREIARRQAEKASRGDRGW